MSGAANAPTSATMATVVTMPNAVKPLSRPTGRASEKPLGRSGAMPGDRSNRRAPESRLEAVGITAVTELSGAGRVRFRRGDHKTVSGLVPGQAPELVEVDVAAAED